MTDLGYNPHTYFNKNTSVHLHVMHTRFISDPPFGIISVLWKISGDRVGIVAESRMESKKTKT